MFYTYLIAQQTIKATNNILITKLKFHLLKKTGINQMQKIKHSNNDKLHATLNVQNKIAQNKLTQVAVFLFCNKSNLISQFFFEKLSESCC